MTKMTTRFLRKCGLCLAPQTTAAHECIGCAAILGVFFVASHVVTVIVTCAFEGFNWGTTAWCLDIMGFLAGFGFAILCANSSNKHSVENRKDNRWIFIWATVTVGSRILDTLMLFGVVKLDDVYTTPSGVVLFTNVISEVIIGNIYVITALTGSAMLLFCPADGPVSGNLELGDDLLIV